MSIRKLSVWLPLLHVVLVGTLIGFEEFRHWQLNLKGIEWADRVRRQERQHPQHTIQSEAAREQVTAFEEAARQEFQPSSATIALYGAELPAALLVGWFQHSISVDFSGFLHPALLELTLGMPPASKVILLDGLLILAIGAQWWLVGIWLRKRDRTNQGTDFQTKLAIAISVGGTVSITLCRAGSAVDFIFLWAILGSAILWVILISNAIYAVANAAWALGYSWVWGKLRAID